MSRSFESYFYLTVGVRTLTSYCKFCCCCCRALNFCGLRFEHWTSCCLHYLSWLLLFALSLSCTYLLLLQLFASLAEMNVTVLSVVRTWYVQINWIHHQIWHVFRNSKLLRHSNFSLIVSWEIPLTLFSWSRLRQTGSVWKYTFSRIRGRR